MSFFNKILREKASFFEKKESSKKKWFDDLVAGLQFPDEMKGTTPDKFGSNLRNLDVLNLSEYEKVTAIGCF